MNLSDLQSDLDEARSWRKHELQQARFIAESADEANKLYLCRAWTLVMYAHCDQFTKEATKSYMRFLGDNHRATYDYWSIWIAFRCKDRMLNSNGDKYSSSLNPREIDRTELIKAICSKDVLESQSFKYESLRFIVDHILQMNFDHQIYKAFCGTLKFKRDQIAHGEQIYVSDASDCLNWHVPTINLIDGLADSILELASTH